MQIFTWRNDQQEKKEAQAMEIKKTEMENKATRELGLAAIIQKNYIQEKVRQAAAEESKADTNEYDLLGIGKST